ncbi:MAG: hypothetical protein ACP5G0_12375 [Desulfomonilia bacterium]
MGEFGIGLIVIAVICVAALVIDSQRSYTVIDNSPEYKKMFEKGILQRRLHKKERSPY